MKLYGLDPESFSRLILSVGSHKGVRPFTPVEVAQALGIMIDNGASLDQCAHAVHLDGTAMISRFLRLNQLDDQVKHLVDWGGTATSIGFTSAQELSRIPSCYHQYLAKTILEHGLRSGEVKQIAQLVIRSGRSASECANEVIGMRPQVEIRHVVVGSIIEEATRSKLSNLTQTERNGLFKNALKILFPGDFEISGSLSPNRFTMAGDHVFSNAFKALKEDFEQVITTQISSLLYGQPH